MRWKTHGWIVVVTIGVLVVGCGGEGTAQPVQGAGGDAAPAAIADPAEMTPTELGEAIGGLYVGALEAVAEAVAERPDAGVLHPRLQEMKDAYIADLVELGRAREALGEADRATVDGKVGMSVSKVPSATFTAYAEGQNHYRKVDSELGELIASFNIITQYANFDLLKKQAPSEAERLGIE